MDKIKQDNTVDKYNAMWIYLQGRQGENTDAW